MVEVKAIDIELLLRWAYRDELAKRVTSSAEGVWDRMAAVGRYGVVVDSAPRAQRYDLGEPHEDALILERGVASLPDAVIDWQREAHSVLGDLMAVLEPGSLENASAGFPGRFRPTASWTTKAGERVCVQLDPPREVATVRTLRTSALVTMHASMGTRPDWREEHPQPLPVPAVRGPNPMVMGKCLRKGIYSEGSYCPLRWWPSPTAVAAARADYLVWWRGLRELTKINFVAHRALAPAVPEMPWLA